MHKGILLASTLMGGLYISKDKAKCCGIVGILSNKR